MNILQQQGAFDEFVQEYNVERPHQALNLKTPASVYQPSERLHHGLEDVDYPFHDHLITVSNCGRICYAGKKVNLSQVLAGQKVGIKEEDDGIWQVSFMHYDIGFFDLESCRVETVENPFGAKVLTM